jgi:hypothetical protein
LIGKRTVMARWKRGCWKGWEEEEKKKEVVIAED